VFIAHMDEVAYIVRSIAGDGTVSLTPQGGVIPSAWEGQPALLHFDPATGGGSTAAPSIRGVFIPRDAATVRRPDQVRAWFGLDSAALAARGVRPGMGVTGYKRAHRLAATRFTARSLDDRAGTTALLLALRAIEPDQLPNKVIFAWSVHEEGGLIGARALARRIGASVRRVYAVDTFVSSDTPLESPHFAFTPLGAGPVLRGLDDGIASAPRERERVVSIARARGIPLQVGTTHGSTDATPFVAAGAPGMGLSWPGRYSHSPAEVLDLTDLSRLARLIEAVAEAGAR
jgi:putative aminopeptidase FrvX